MNKSNERGAPGYRPMAEVMEQLFEVEDQYGLLDFEWEGWCAWPLIRFAVERCLERRPLDMVARPVSRRRRYAAAMRDAACLARPKRAKCLVKTYASARADRVEGRYKDIYFDDLILAARDVFKLESSNSASFLDRSRQALVPANMSTSLLMIVSHHLSRLNRPRCAERVASSLVRALEVGLGSRTIGADTAAEILRAFYWTKQAYRLVLDRVQPETVLTADPGEFAITAAAKEAGLRVLELQHGFVSRHYVGYAWSRASRRYRARMPLPDEILVYGPHWKSELCALGFWDERDVHAVGSARLDGYRESRQRRPEGPLTLLLTTQGTDTERLVEFMEGFLNGARGSPAVSLVIKLHPHYDSRVDLYQGLASSHTNVTVVPAEADPSTFALMVRADLHLSIFSTCHYEAIGLGVPTVVLPLHGHENVLPLVEAGHAYFVETPSALVTLASRVRELAVPDRIAEHYFTPGAVANVTKRIAA